jgi:hypothetical protein
VATEIDGTRGFGPDGGDGGTQAGLVALSGTARGRPVRALLTEGQIATEDGHAALTERVSKSHQQRGIAVGASAVGQHQGGG